MEALTSSAPAGGLSRGIGGVAVLVLGAVALYYLYDYLYGSQGGEYTSVITSARSANPTKNQQTFTVDPQPLEGGEYSVSFWIYLTGFKDQTGLNKHVLELRGVSSSTLVVGLGSFTNKLIVRVNTSSTGGLTTANVKSMFETRQIPGSIAAEDSTPFCDLPEIELQRWINISIVMNGRTTDVYLDGKLARSCVSKDFKVDPAGVRLKLTDFGGFDGFISDVSLYSYAINPEQAYRIYMAGPSDVQANGFVNWLKGIFNVQGSVTYTYPSFGVNYSKSELNF